MYNPFKYPQFFYTIIFVIHTIGFFICFHGSYYNLKDFIENKISIIQIVSLHPKAYRVTVHLMCVSYAVLSRDFFSFSKKVSKNSSSPMMSLLQYFQQFCCLISVIGLLGIATCLEVDNVLLQMSMEILYLLGALSFLLIFDLILGNIYHNQLPLLIWLYNIIMMLSTTIFVMLDIKSYIDSQIESPTLFCFFTEYSSHLFILFKFIINGWELQVVQKSLRQKVE